MKPDPSKQPVASVLQVKPCESHEDFEPLTQWDVLSLIYDISWRHCDNTLGNSCKPDSVLHFAKLLSV